MIKKWWVILLAILLLFAAAGCLEEPMEEEISAGEEAEAPPVEEEPEPEPEPEREENPILGIRDLSQDEAVDLAYAAFERVLDHIFPEPGAVDMDVVIGFAGDAMGTRIQESIQGNWRASVGPFAEWGQVKVFWDFGPMEDRVEMYLEMGDIGEEYFRFVRGDTVIEFHGEDEEDEPPWELMDYFESYAFMFISIDMLWIGDFLSAEIEDAEDGSTRYTIVLCEFGAEDIMWGNHYMMGVLEDFLEHVMESGGMEIFPVFQEGLFVIDMDAEGRPVRVHVGIEIAFDAEEELDLRAQFTRDYTFNAFDQDVVIQRPA